MLVLRVEIKGFRQMVITLLYEMPHILLQCFYGFMHQIPDRLIFDGSDVRNVFVVHAGIKF
jgi:hypothetical protein